MVPKLVVVLVGEDLASHVYVRNKERGCGEVGMSSEVVRYPVSVKEKEIVDKIDHLNKRQDVHGILVQLPLPKHLDEITILNGIDPMKDVDGLHPMNLGKLLKGDKTLFVPCTANGVMELILSTGVEIAGKEAVIIGRSNIVGKPTALLLLKKNATVTICHSKTSNLAETVRRGDIVVAAVGRPKLITGEMIKEDAVVVDVGTSKVGGRLTGDVDFEAAKDRASFITPVPGGVGPMTIAMLLKNTYLAAVGLAG
jgi:methylenetetrahydrofolate dehydrogenase (NADP+)/methenyltetrahydrofolate cyclohydrolase